MTSGIAARRTEIEAEIVALKARRGEGRLDGLPVDGESAAILRLQIELDSLTEAEGVAADRDRDAAERNRLHRLAELRSELAGLEHQRLEAIQITEMAVRNAADGLNRLFEVSKAMARVAHQIDPRPTPAGLMATDVETRMAARVCGVLAKVRGVSRGRLGHLELLATGLYPHTDDWVEKERKGLAAHLEPLIAGAVPKVKPRTLMITKENAINGDDH
jgi:hypothetical protein